MTEVLDQVLAGPFLRYTTTTEAYVWLATSTPLAQAGLGLEFWDPSPRNTGRIFYEPLGANTMGRLTDFHSTRLAAHLHVHLLHTRFTKRLAPKKAYAYRVVLNPNGSVGGQAIIDPPATLERLVQRGPKPRGAKQFASFVLGDPYEWWLWGLPSQAYLEVTAAATDLRDNLVKHPPSARRGLSDLAALPAPTSLFFFGTPFTFSDEMPEAGLQGIHSLARELCGLIPTPDEWLKAFYSAAYLLAWSPALWQREFGAEAPALGALEACVNSTALLMANTPSYVLGAGAAPQRFSERAIGGIGGLAGMVANAFSKVANVVVNATFADQPNTVEGASTFDLAKIVSGVSASVARTFVVRGPPSIGCVVPGDSAASVLDGKVIPDRIPTIVAAEPVLRMVDGTTREGPGARKEHEVTLVLSFTSGRAFVAESGDELGSKPVPTYSPSTDATMRGKVIEVAASLGGAPESVPQDQALSVVVQKEAADRRFASIRRQGNKVSLSLEPLQEQELPYEFVLPDHGRLYAVVDKTHDGLHLGNRFWVYSSSADLSQADSHRGLLEGVRVGIYGGNAAPVVLPATADADGWVNLLLDGCPDGDYVLRIEGPETFDHAGPDTPVEEGAEKPAGKGLRFRERVWLKQSFTVGVVDEHIATIDDEPVPSPTFRLLIDPVWMHSVRGHRQHPRKVSVIVLHRTDTEDARHTASSWQDKSDVRGAHYLLARDGTLIKCADESENIGHAGEEALTWWNGKHGLNSFSIGVEISKQETWEPYTEKQYASLIVLVRRFSVTERSVISVPPYNIVGHSDIRLLTPNTLGGRNDPGLAFDWTRLERRFLGLRRLDEEPPNLFSEFTDPPRDLVLLCDTFNRKSTSDRRREGPALKPKLNSVKRANPTPLWEGEIEAAENRFDVQYPSGTPVEEIEADFRADLERIGYFVTAKASNDTFRAALRAFRTHFFSGPRRTSFRAKFDLDSLLLRSTEEELDTHGLLTREGKLTVVWAHEVAEHLATARARADENDSSYDGERGWKEAKEVEEAEAGIGTASPISV